MNDEVFFVQTLEGKGDDVTNITYNGVFSTWDDAVAAANKYEKIEFAKPDDSIKLYAEDIKCFGDNEWRSVRIIPMRLNEWRNIA